MAHIRVTEIDDPRSLGDRLRQLRLQRGFSLRELAFPGCTAPYISTIEHGRRVPSLQVLTALAERLGSTAGYLATGEEMSVTLQLSEAELALRLGEVDRAEELFTALGNAATESVRTRGMGGLGVVALERGQLVEGIRLLEQARETAPVEFLTVSWFVDALGRAYATRSEYESAVALFGAARAQAEERGDRPAALKLTVLLANTYIDSGDTSHSMEALADALSDSAELHDPRLRASVFRAQARLHTVEGRHDLAAEFAERALDTLRVLEDDRSVAVGQQMMAYIEIERGHPQRALELLELATPTIDRLAETIERAVFHLERARALVALHRDEEARDILVEIGPTLREGPEGDGGRYYVLLGELYERLGNDDDAIQMYDAAIERLSNHRNPHLVRAYRLKSELLERLGRADEALAALRQAVAVQDATAQREHPR